MEDRTKPLTEQFLERAASMPDKWTLAWWKEQWDEIRSGYAGLNHRMNLSHVEYQACLEAVKRLEGRIEAMEKACRGSDVEIGRIREAVAEVEVSVGKAREAFVSLRKGKTKAEENRDA